MSCGCKDKQSTTSTASGILCTRCLWFWVAVAVVAFLTLYHYHDSNGNVHLG